MKRLLTTIGILCLSIGMALAQVVPSPQPGLQKQLEYAPEDFIKLQPEEVPPVLRKTLERDEYTGWEKGMIYRNKLTSEYVVEISDNNTKKTYRFDKNGNRIEDL